VQKTGNVVLIDKYAQKTALRLGVSPDSVRAEFKKLFRGKRSAAIATEEPMAEPTVQQPPSPLEIWLLKILLLHDEWLDWAVAHLDVSWVQHPLVREVVMRRFAAHSHQTWRSVAALLAECETPELQNLITEAVAQEQAVANPAQQMADITTRLRNQFIDSQLAVLIQRLNQPELQEPDRLQLLRQQQELRASKRKPLATSTAPASP